MRRLFAGMTAACLMIGMCGSGVKYMRECVYTAGLTGRVVVWWVYCDTRFGSVACQRIYQFTRTRWERLGEYGLA